MYAFHQRISQSLSRKFDLTYDDIMGLQYLYGKPQNMTPSTSTTVMTTTENTFKA